MDASAFQPDSRVMATLREPGGVPRPGRFYVLRAHPDFLVVRMADGEGLLRRIDYGTIERIVETLPIAPRDRIAVPAALLEAAFWQSRATLAHYGSSAARGK
jgi:hypothetical protein